MTVSGRPPASTTSASQADQDLRRHRRRRPSSSGRARSPASSATGRRVTDQTAAGSSALYNTDLGAAKIATALTNPAHYFTATFSADAGVPYHLWIRMKALNNHFANDSIHVQFSDSVDAASAPIYRIGSTGADNSAPGGAPGERQRHHQRLGLGGSGMERRRPSHLLQRRAASTRCGFSSARTGSPSIKSCCRRTRS